MSENPKTRASLILRLKRADDLRAWEDFAEIYQPLIYSLARKRGLQEADAFDLTQEVLTRVARSIERWDPDPQLGSFRGWLATITRNMVIEFFRRNNRLPLTGTREEIQLLLEAGPVNSTETGEFDLEHKRQVFTWASKKIEKQFEPSTWRAFWMTAVEQCSVADAVAETGISRGAVYIARSRVLARLRETVQAAHFESGIREANQ